MKRTLLTILGWAISLVLLWKVLHGLSAERILHGLERAHAGWLLMAAVINIGVVALKALRWRWLVRPEARVTWWEAFKVTMIGFAGNNIFPARGGDWFKIYLFGKRQNVSKSMLTSVTILDKLFDGIIILLLFGLFSIYARFPLWVQNGTIVVGGIMAVLLGACVVLLMRYRRLGDQGIGSGRLRSMLHQFSAGTQAIGRWDLMLQIFGVTVASSALQIVMIVCVQEAFGLTLGAWVPALVYVAINLAMMIPSAPSGVGPFEAAAVLAYTWFGVGKESATLVAFMYHAVQFFPVTLAGLVLYITGGRGKRKTKER